MTSDCSVPSTSSAQPVSSASYAPFVPAPGITALRCHNPSPMTLTGTVSYLVDTPAGQLIVDPGPAEPHTHLEALAELVRAGGPALAIVLTHYHADHSGGAQWLADELDVDVWAVDHERNPVAAARLRGPLPDDEDLLGTGVSVWRTPGHTSDSICLHVPGPDALLTGDTILGEGPTVLAAPDGALGDYLATLDLIEERCRARGIRAGLPAHGERLPDPIAAVRDLRAHREERLAQVAQAYADLSATQPDASRAEVVEAIAATVYADVDPALARAIRWSIEAQLEHLAASE